MLSLHVADLAGIGNLKKKGKAEFLMVTRLQSIDQRATVARRLPATKNKLEPAVRALGQYCDTSDEGLLVEQNALKASGISYFG